MCAARTDTDKVGGYTWNDFVNLPEDDPRELIDGQLIDIEGALEPLTPTRALRSKCVVATLQGMSAATHETQAPPQYTWDDFVNLPEDDRRELIDGQLVEVEVPTELHEHITAALVFFLFGWSRSHGARVQASGYKVRVAEGRGVMPDVQVYRKGNLGVLDEQGVTRGRPDLAVEVISPSSERYDRVTKLTYYLELGVPEYWIVHPERRVLERLVLTEGGYLIAEQPTDDAVFAPASFEGLEIPLAELWTAPGDDAPVEADETP